MKAAARLMEKIVPGASTMKAKSSSKKDQYLLKRRDAPEASSPAAHRANSDGSRFFPSLMIFTTSVTDDDATLSAVDATRMM